jgi:glycosyltransferase involved in cell wall biosynthesis
MELPHVHVIVPALDEGAAIGEVIERTKQALRGFEYEIVVVDGFSTDSTVLIAKQLGATVLTEKSHGYGAAFLTGFEYAMSRHDNSIVVMIDADSTYDPEDIPALIEPILEGKADLTLANRFANMEPNAMSMRNQIGNKIISKIVSKLYGVRITDSQTGLRAITANCLRAMFLEAKGMPLATEMLIEARKLGARITEVNTKYHARVGESKIRALHDGYGILSTSLRLVSELNPFAIYGSLGALFFLLGIGFGAYAFVGWYQWQFLGASTWPRLGSALLSVLFLVGGTVIFGLGILLDSLLRYMRAAAHRERVSLQHT